MKRISLFTLLIPLVLMNACKEKEQADLLLFNGKIYSVDASFKIVEAMAVKDGKILALGNTKELENAYRFLKKTDLNGSFVYPGFIDAHCHFYGLALMMQQADLSGSVSFEEVLERLKIHRELYYPKWLTGRGWDQNLWENKEYPDNGKLDSLFPDIPVVLTRIDGHAVIANSKALALAGIDSSTEIDGGMVILKDGKPTGVLIDNAANKMSAIVPKPEGDELRSILVEAQTECFRKGLTTVADAGLSKNTVLFLEDMQNERSLKINIYAMLDPSNENINYFVKKGVYKSDRLSVRSIKLYADGALGSRGACLLKPYSDDTLNTGLMVESIDTLRYYCKMAFDNHYQVCIHAIGDSAVRSVLNLYSEFLEGNNDLRWRIEHAQVVDPDDFTLFYKYQIIPSVQPTHATSDMYWAGERLGPDRIRFAYAYKDLMAQNDWIPFGTDFPIEKIDPLLTFYAAVFRKDTKGYPASGFQPENSISREDALRGMTIWAAKACFEENEIGSLEAGKYADFVILSNDILSCSEKEVLNTKILKTFVRGEQVYDTNNR